MSQPRVRNGRVAFGPQFRHRGFTLFELAVAALIFSILTVVLLQRVSFYQDEAERAAVKRMARDLQAALNLRSGSFLAQGRAGEIADLAGQNPMELLAQKPPHYLGQFYSPDEQDLEAGSWYFDRTTRKLVYVFRDSKLFQPDATKRIYFRVESAGLPTIPAKPTRMLADKPSVVLTQVDG